uniref:torsin-1A-interacting protein 2-like isoform X2 n=1 Tax=Myxine glutinosa TaxID=7769 RepID=UPI00358F41DB
MEGGRHTVKSREGISRTGRMQRNGKAQGDGPGKGIDNKQCPSSISPPTSKRFHHTEQVNDKQSKMMAGDGRRTVYPEIRLHPDMRGEPQPRLYPDVRGEPRGSGDAESSEDDIGDGGGDAHRFEPSDECDGTHFEDEELFHSETIPSQKPRHTRKGFDVHASVHTERRTKTPENKFVHHRNKLAGIIAVLILLLSIILFCYNPLPSSSESSKADQLLLSLQRRIHALQKSFPNQSHDFWHRIHVILRRALKASPAEARPTVLLLASGPQATYSMNCLAQHVGSAYLVNNSLPPISISGNDFGGLSGEETKMRLDNLLNSQMSGVERPAAVVSRIDVLPPQATLIFYKYCDHESAQYPSALLVFTIRHKAILDEALARTSLSSQMLTRFQEEVELSLRARLLGVNFDEDKFGGLWSRIGINVLPVITEEKIHNEGCPAVNSLN